MIAVFFGGMSCEHDISIITGLQTLAAVSHRAAGVYIGADGLWQTSDEFDSVKNVKQQRFKGKPVYIRAGEPYLYSKNKRLFKIDAAVLCNHGILGEDGCLQGLLEMSGIPYTGSGVAASAIGMNKLLSKRVFEGAGLDIVPYKSIERDAYQKDAHTAVKPLIDELGFPIIVKPCNLGSSIGISVANNLNELYAALRVAFEWDDTVIAEKALVGFTEVNCAVLGDGLGNGEPSETEQPVGWKSFLTFADKYGGDVKSLAHKMPADVGAEQNAKIKELAVIAYNAVGCAGVARMDFMLGDGRIYANEINTIPGSLAYPLFAGKYNFSELIDKQIEYALARRARFERLNRTYTPVQPIINGK